MEGTWGKHRIYKLRVKRGRDCIYITQNSEPDRQGLLSLPYPGLPFIYETDLILQRAHATQRSHNHVHTTAIR